LADHHGVEELDCFVEPIFHARIAHFGEAEHRGPDSCLAQRQAAGTARQRQTQQAPSGVYFAFALDRLGLMGERVEIEIGGKPAEQFVEPVRGEGCGVLHLTLESYRFAPGQKVF
jgi:hypothetical protein